MNNSQKHQAKSELLRDTRGLSTVEYVILMAIVVVGAVATWNEIGTKVKGKLGESRNDLNTMGDEVTGN